MALSDIAAGLVTTESQCDRGVAVVDRTDRSMEHAIAPFVDDLPCGHEAAVTLVDAYVAGNSVGSAARDAGLPPMTGAKTLHLLGFEGLSPLTPLGRTVLEDWLQASITRRDARALTDTSETEFALAVFIETHSPLEGAAERIGNASTTVGNAAVEKRDALEDTMSDPGAPLF
ncbi:MAG: hypothetical protein ABEJ58_05585 [Halodesulfurarchaeum sp.]